jgi:acyl-CoA synthetase (AMP-forming)/AMP-acid ligase II
VVDGDLRLTYAELNGRVNRLAHALAERGYGRGDRLALVAANCAEFLVVYFACAKLGLVFVPVNLSWDNDEVTHVLRHSGARGVVAQADRLAGLEASIGSSPGVVDVVSIGGVGPGRVAGRGVDRLEDLLAGAPADEPEALVEDRDPLSFLYTSGTTSAPKGVVGSHLAIYVESLSMALEGRFDATDRFVALLPMFHTAQLNVHCTPAIAVGATIHVMAGFDPGRLLELIQRERITQIFCLPMMYRALLDHPDISRRDLGSLRRATYAMAPMPEPDLRRAMATFGCEFSLLFGQTEMSPATTIFRPEHQLSHAGAVGTPVVNVEVAIMGSDGTLLPPTEQGEIVYRGPHAMSGYHDDPAATEAAFAGGWFHSGDSGVFDEDGILWFRDRFKDVIKTGGENVESLEVEKAILSHVPGVAEAAVVGLPHDRWSEAVTAFVVPAPGASIDLEVVRRSLQGHLDAYKRPKAVVIVDALPRTSTGKVRKTQLRAEHGDLYGGED